MAALKGETPDWGCRGRLLPDHLAFRFGDCTRGALKMMAFPNFLPYCLTASGVPLICPLTSARPCLTGIPGSVHSKRVPSVPPW